MMQRNVPMSDVLWRQLSELAPKFGVSRAQIVRDILYTAVKHTAEGKSIVIEGCPRPASAYHTGPEQGVVTEGGQTQWCTIDPATGFRVA